ncbi:site-specific integrase [Pseudodesulfovibrio senegalensis]|uniref:Tyrosine-type recombinase/integrase n=1 Tax=Pseudodesulfovibrio senegalensis TaxID=1721087 RepID=A0A6N6NAS1_9BACT|nr:site-specific integrase [Pseudodesulfovibrio senegalensis]KAB1443747.1 tyrosine-type recombinase/integrase [Pseudodesulfovibrio senegalensis]
MEDMAKYPGLTKRKGTNNYQLRRKVPVDLQEQYGKKEITRSLRTSNYHDAVEKYRIETMKLDQEFAEERRKHATVQIRELSQIEIERLAAIAYYDELKEDEDKRTNGLSEIEHADYKELLETLESEGRERLARGDTQSIEDYAEELLAEQGISLDKDTEDFKKLTMKLLEGFVKANKVMRERHRGQPIPTPTKPAPMPTAEKNHPLAATPTITEIHKMWAKEHLAGGGPKKTATDFAIYVRRFAELHGDLPVGEITKPHVRDFKDAMLRLPSRFTGKLKGMTVPKALEYAAKNQNIRTLSPRTVNDKALGAIGAILSWAVDNGYIDHNPASKVKVKAAKVKGTTRLPYSVEDMNKIFRFPVYTNGERPIGGRGEAAYWLPLLAAFTGARLEEIGQLTVEDIKEERGVTFFDMTTVGEGQRRKTESSKRRVPIHPQLVKLGILKYANSMKKGRLFPEVRSNQGQITASFSQWWGRYARKHGITDKRKVFHSFRHAAKDGFREGGVEEQISDALTGHAPRTEGRKYGSDAYPITQLAAGIEKLVYPGLDLGHLLQNK